MNKAGEWRQWRADSQRSGRVALPGKILNPGIAGRHFLGGMEDWLVLKYDAESKGHFILPDTAIDFDESDIGSRWGIERRIDIEGTGLPEKVTESERLRYLQIQGENPGFLRLFFESAFDKGMQGEDTRGWMEKRVGGEWKRIWTTPPDCHYWRPNILITDIDGDGDDDIVVSAHYRLMAFNKHTGEKTRELNYHKYRNYGDIHAFDFTGNGLCDFLQIVYFPAHIEVVLNDGKKFNLAWLEDIQHGDITDSEHMVMSPYYPIADIDDDGMNEIIYARYNEKGDEKWHTLVLEPLTGHIKYDIADFVVQDVFSLEPGGKPKMFGVRSQGMFVRTTGGAVIYEIGSDNAVLFWEDERVSWCFWVPYPWTNYISSRSSGDERKMIARFDNGSTVLCKEVIPHEKDIFKLTACRFDGCGRQVMSKAFLPAFQIKSMNCNTGEILLTTTRCVDKMEITAEGFMLDLAGSRPTADGIAPPVVVETDDGTPVVVVPDLLNRVQCLVFDKNGGIKVKWKTNGHGMSNVKGVCAGRAQNDRRFIVYVSSNEKGEARIVQADLSGRRIWETDIAGIHDALQPAEGGGVLHFQTMPLLRADMDDIIVTSLKNNMHSGFTIALNGNDGRQIWRQDKSGAVFNEVRGYGGDRPFAGYPRDDGTEDLVSEFPDLFYIADGKNGSFTVYNHSQNYCFHIYDNEHDVVKNIPVLYGTPVVISNREISEKTGGYDCMVLWGGCTFTTGLWVKKGDVTGFSWFIPPYSTLDNCPLQGIGDLDGDGKIEVIGWENRKKAITGRSLMSGELIWSVPIISGNAGRYFITCDINGDGREECIFCTSDHLVVLGERDGKGFVVWKMDLPAPCTQPVVADVDCDGYCEILLPCMDGFLYLVRNSE